MNKRMEQGGDIAEENQAEEAFKSALQDFENAGADQARIAAAFEKAEAAAKMIEDEEKREEALAQVEKLRETL